MNDATELPRTMQRRPRTWLRYLVVLALAGLLAAGFIWFQNFKTVMIGHIVATIKSGVPTVATAKASVQDWQPRQMAVGSARASNGADLAAEIAGVVDKIDFVSGQDVTAGTELLRLRPNDDDAKLAQLQANAALAGVTLRRDQQQFAAHGVAQATVDTDSANLKIAQAQVAAQQAVMAEKIVRAPFAGRIGVRLVDLGQFLAAGTAIVTLQQLDPMFVDFYLPQQALGQIAAGQTVSVTADAYPGQTFGGTVLSLNAKIDSASRMLQVRANIPNPDKKLLAGMYLSVSVNTGPVQPLVTIPLAAVAFNPYGSLVYVLQDKDGKQTVRQQFVTTGASRGDQVSILKGIAADDIIVTAGQLKLHNGSAVKIDNTLQPANNPAPLPLDR